MKLAEFAPQGSATRFGHNGMGLFQFQGSERWKLIGGDFQGGDAKTLRN